MLKIEMGIGWKPDPEKDGGLVSCTDSDYVAEIERLRSALEAATAAADPTLLKPQKLSGSAVERDQGVKDLNHSPTPNEELWYKKSLAQDAEITASQEGFFATLRERIDG